MFNHALIYSFVQVDYNGVISFDITSARSIFISDCPISPAEFQHNFIAAYWLNYNRGNVRMFTHTPQNPVLAPRDLRTIANDLTKAFGIKAMIYFANIGYSIHERGPFNATHIQKVIVITWENMYNNVNTKTELVSELRVVTRGLNKSSTYLNQIESFLCAHAYGMWYVNFYHSNEFGSHSSRQSPERF